MLLPGRARLVGEPSPFLLAEDPAPAALVGGTGTGTMQSIYSCAGLGPGLGSAGSSADLWLSLREVQQQAERTAGPRTRPLG